MKLLLDKLNDDILRVLDWLNVNKMELNCDKSELLIIARPRVKKSLENLYIMIGNNVIKPKQFIKCLGLTIDSDLKWCEHIIHVSKKCNNILKSLYPLKNLISFNNKKLVVEAHILSRIRYMSPVVETTNKHNIKILENILRRAGRFVGDISKFDPIKRVILSKMNWLFPVKLFQFEALKIAYAIVHNIAPPYFKDYLNFEADIINIINTRSSSIQIINSNQHSYGNKAFKYRLNRLWLSIPSSVRNSSSISIFKNKLFQYLLNEELVNLDTRDKFVISNCCDYSCIDSVIENLCKY
jgi:hypothetical protein